MIYKGYYKIILAIISAIMYKEKRVLLVCKSGKEKETTMNAITNKIYSKKIKDVSNYKIEFTNGSYIEVIESNGTVRGNRAKLNPLIDPYEFYLNYKTMGKILLPFEVKLTFLQKLRLKLSFCKNVHLSSRKWWKR